MTTETDLKKGFALGPWEVLPDRGLLRDGERSEHLEPLVMRVLVALAAANGEVLSKDELIETVWDGRALSDEPLNRCISILRRKLGDDSRDPRFVQNIPRLGYRLMQPVKPALAIARDARPAKRQVRARYAWMWGVAAVLMTLALVLGVQKYIGDFSEPELRSIAVYPFECLGVAEEHLCFGFSEELTSTLLYTARVKIVKIRDPMPKSIAADTLAEELRVDALLHGSVQQIGDRLKITAELTDGDDGYTEFLNTLDGPVTQVFELQEQLASDVQAAMFPDIAGPVVSPSRPASFAAYDPYSRGRLAFERRTRESIEESVRLFEQTIAVDPEFGFAYLRLAYAYLLLPEYDSSLDIEALYDKAAATARAGIAADPGIRETASTVFGFIHHKRGEWRQADAAFRIAIDAETVFPLTRNWYSRFLATTGRLHAALLQAQLAYEQAPDNVTIISRLAITNLWVGNLDAAGHFFDLANDRGQASPIHDLAYALFLLRSGKYAEAERFTRQGLEKYGYESGWVASVYAGLERPEQRAEAIATLEHLEADGRLAGFVVMTLWALLDEPERALHTLQGIEGIGQDLETGLEVMFSEDLRALRDGEAFAGLLESAGLIDYWAGNGCHWSGDALSCRQ